jgi:hypothetical protein
MKKLLGSLILTLAAGFVPWASAADDRWIHLRVDDADGAKGRVDIQVPIGMVATLLPVLNGKHGKGSIHIDGSSVDVAELRGYWSAVRSAKDGDYVTVRNEGSDVRISKSDGFLRVSVDGSGRSGRVRMKVPLPLVDAVLAGGDTIDLAAVGGALARAPSGELLTVDGDDGHVRVWIDAKPEAAREETP